MRVTKNPIKFNEQRFFTILKQSAFTGLMSIHAKARIFFVKRERKRRHNGAMPRLSDKA